QLLEELKALRRQKEAFETIFEHIPVMIRFMDPTGQWQMVNPEWQRVLGWSLEEVRGRDIWREFYPDPVDYQRATDFIRQSTGKWADFRSRVRDGRVLDTSWASILLSDGTSIGIGQDITERKRAEEKLRQSYEDVQALSRRLLTVQEE